MTKYKIDRSVTISKSKLRTNPWNPNHMKDRQQEAVKESIRDYGQVMELLVRPHPEEPEAYQIIDGEHRFNVLPDMVYCNVIYGLPDSEAKKLTVVMNETRGEADKIDLAVLLSELSSEMEMENLRAALPYEIGELEELIKLADVDWEQFNQNQTPEPIGNEDSEDGAVDDNANYDGDLVFATVAFSPRTLDLLAQVESLLKDDQELPEKQAEKYGVVIEVMAESYLAI